MELEYIKAGFSRTVDHKFEIIKRSHNNQWIVIPTDGHSHLIPKPYYTAKNLYGCREIIDLIYHKRERDIAYGYHKGITPIGQQA